MINHKRRHRLDKAARTLPTIQETIDLCQDLGLLPKFECVYVPAIWMLDPRLKHHDKALLVLLFAYSNEDFVVEITYRKMCMWLKMDRKALTQAMKRLIACGFLKKLEYQNGFTPKYKIITPDEMQKNLTDSGVDETHGGEDSRSEVGQGALLSDRGWGNSSELLGYLGSVDKKLTEILSTVKPMRPVLEAAETTIGDKRRNVRKSTRKT